MSAPSPTAAFEPATGQPAARRFLWHLFWLLLLASLTAQALIYGVITAKPVIRSDGVGYYLYLPAALIHGDLTLGKVTAHEFPDGVPGGCVNEFDGHRVIKYPLGEALLQLPFFLVARVVAAALGVGSAFGWPYQMGAAAAGAFYFALGGCFTWVLLRERFSPRVAGWALLLTIFGTNLFHYATYDAGFSHVYSFCLAAALLLISSRLPNATDVRAWLALGLCAGLIATTRPTNVVLLVFPLGMWLTSAGSASLAWSRLRAWRGGLLAAAGAAAVPVALQMAYWKIATGHWVFYSYGQEGFDFLHPAVGKVLFSVEKGWFVYLPLALVAIGGWLVSRGKLAGYFPAIVSFTVVNLWIIASWHDWGYGGSFATRPLVDSSSLFALGVAGALGRLDEQPKRQRLLLGFALVCVIYTSLLMLGYWLRTLPYSQATLTDIVNSLMLVGLRR